MQCPHCNAQVQPAVEIIPLDRAAFWVDCRCITIAKNDHCLSCGSRSLLTLANVLDRELADTDSPADGVK